MDELVIMNAHTYFMQALHDMDTKAKLLHFNNANVASTRSSQNEQAPADGIPDVIPGCLSAPYDIS